MGKEYVKVGGENDVVSEVIFEYYFLRFVGDIFFKINVGVVLLIVDKLDLIVGFFVIGI